VVYELSSYIHYNERSNIGDVEELIQDRLGQFCSIEALNTNYKDMVADMCWNFENKTLAIKNALLEAYLDRSDSLPLVHPKSLFQQTKDVCESVGVCSASEWEFVSTPQVTLQEQWDHKCFVCQAAARNMEGYLQLTRRVAAKSINPIVMTTCDRLQLKGEFDVLCRQMLSGKLLEDVCWFAKVHAESVMRKDRGEMRFPDKLCEELNWCVPWVDPEELREKEIRDTMEPVFF